MSDPAREHGRLFWVVGLLVLLSWLGSMGWLLRGRLEPASTRQVSYAALLPQDSLTLTYRVMVGQRAAGRLRYEVIRQGRARRLSWEMHILAQPAIPGTDLTGWGESVFDSTGLLSRFRIDLKVASHTLTLEGTREDEVLRLKGMGFGVQLSRAMTVDSTFAVGDGVFSGLVSGCVRPNEKLVWQALDPLTSGVSEVVLVAQVGLRLRAGINEPSLTQSIEDKFIAVKLITLNNVRMVTYN